jgi:hypothetical protein
MKWKRTRLRPQHFPGYSEEYQENFNQYSRYPDRDLNQASTEYEPKHFFLLFEFLGVGWDWVHLVRRPLTGLLYQPRIDECGAFDGRIISGGNQIDSKKTCPSATLSTKNPIWPHLCSNPGHHGGKPATKRLSYGTVSIEPYVGLFSGMWCIPVEAFRRFGEMYRLQLQSQSLSQESNDHETSSSYFGELL